MEEFGGSPMNPTSRDLRDASRQSLSQLEKNYLKQDKWVNYFEKACQNIIDMHRKKAADYTDSREFGNFEDSAKAADITVLQAIENLIGTKEARIRNLQRKAREGKDAPLNESLEDSYYDRAVYAVISYSRYMYEKDKEGLKSELNAGMDKLETLFPSPIRPIEDVPQPAGELICARCGHGRSNHFPWNLDKHIACSCCYAHSSIPRNDGEVANTCFVDKAFLKKP